MKAVYTITLFCLAAALPTAQSARAQPAPYHADQADPVLRTLPVTPAPAQSPFLYRPRAEAPRAVPAPVYEGPVAQVFPAHPGPVSRPGQGYPSRPSPYSSITPPGSVAAPANPASPSVPRAPSVGTRPSVNPGAVPDKVYRTPGNAPPRNRPAYSAPGHIHVQPVVPMQPQRPHRPGQNYPYRPLPPPRYPGR